MSTEIVLEKVVEFDVSDNEVWEFFLDAPARRVSFHEHKSTTEKEAT